MNTTLRIRVLIGMVFFALGTLISCGTPATPEESCLSASKSIVKERENDSTWPAAITDVSPIRSNPILCEGLGLMRNGNSEVIQFYENSDEIRFYSTPLAERKCDAFLMNEVIELSKEKGDTEILKIYDPEEVSNTGAKLTCRGDALLDSNEREAIEFYIEEDEDEDRFIGYGPEEK